MTPPSAPAPAPSSVQFHNLIVTDVEALTDDAVAVTFAVPEDLADAFTHTPGQYVVIKADLGGQDVRRSYSLCSRPGGGSFTVGIKRIPDGVFSTYATTKLSPGDTLEVTPPVGEFARPVNPSVSGHLVAVAAGSGITPVLSIVASALSAEPNTTATLIYGNRTSQTIMFLEALEDLKDRYPERFQLVHVLSREPHQVSLFEGRIDASKVEALCGSLIDPAGVDGWYLCGPVDMVETVGETLTRLGVPEGRVHRELFFDQRIDPPMTAAEDGTGSGETVTLSFEIDGRTSVVAVDPAGPSLLDYARTVRAEVPFACKGGMCATCKATLVEGEVTMEKNYALTDEELAAGSILTCQAHPVGDVTVRYG